MYIRGQRRRSWEKYPAAFSHGTESRLPGMDCGVCSKSVFCVLCAAQDAFDAKSNSYSPADTVLKIRAEARKLKFVSPGYL